MLPDIACEMPADGEQDVLFLRRPRGRHKGGSRPSVRKGIRRPLFTRPMPGSSRSWVGCLAAPGSSTRVSRRSCALSIRAGGIEAARGGGRTPPRTKSPDGRGGRRPRTRPRGRPRGRPKRTRSGGRRPRTRPLKRPRGRSSWTRRGSGLRVCHGGVLGRRTVAGDIARERSLADGREGGRHGRGGGSGLRVGHRGVLGRRTAAGDVEVGPAARADILAGKCAEGRPPEVLAGEDEVGRRAEDEGRPPDVLSGKDVEG